MQAEELVQAGQLSEALSALEAEVRADPTNARLRISLFQLLSVLGDWARAINQLNVAAELDAIHLLIAQIYRAAINCEVLRADIFAGKRSPLVLGKPDEWIGWLMQANQMTAEEKYPAAKKLREQAFEAAPAIPGTIDGQSFEWIADGDSRMGPVLEAIIDGKYYWAPFTAIRQIQIEEPKALRDLVWAAAHFTWTNGGQASGLIPTRYPGSESSRDNAVKLSRKTDWTKLPGDAYAGMGQRMLYTDDGEFALLEVRRIDLDNVEVDQ